MSRIKPAGLLTFLAAATAIAYRGYFKQVPTDGSADPGPPAYDDPFFDVKTPPAPDANGNIVLDLGSVALPPIEGTLRVGFSAFDTAGNESDIGPAVDFPLDQQAPAAPGLPGVHACHLAVLVTVVICALIWLIATW